MTIYSARETQIALLVAKKMIIPAKYLDFTNVFSKELVTESSKHFDIIKFLINLESNKQPPYGSIYRLGLVELKIFKTYIVINLANGFIWQLKVLAKAFI